MPESKTAEERADLLMSWYEDHISLALRDEIVVQLRDYALQHMEAWKEQAVVETQRQLNKEGPKGLFIARQSWNAAVSHVATVLHTLPVETP